MGPKFLASPSWLLVMRTIINDEKLSLTKERVLRYIQFNEMSSG